MPDVLEGTTAPRRVFDQTFLSIRHRAPTGMADCEVPKTVIRP
ncbi:hypothetical protein [Streptomyces sp. NPDC056479]